MSVLGSLLGVLVRLWVSTLRIEVREHAALADFGDRPWVLCFHHGRQMPLLGWRRRRPTVVMVSHSKDGALQARLLRMLGLSIVRGSSSRGGARGLAALVRAMRKMHDAAFAVDGPRGPLGVAKGGALLAARATNAALIPMGSAGRKQHTVARAWDRFAIPWPFTRAVVVLGAPIDPESAGAREALEVAIASANREAERCAQSR